MSPCKFFTLYISLEDPASEKGKLDVKKPFAIHDTDFGVFK